MKHRTQIMLEEWQYYSLQEMARRTGTTLSSLIRDWVSEKIQGRNHKSSKGLLALAGKIKDKSDVAVKHDAYLADRR